MAIHRVPGDSSACTCRDEGFEGRENGEEAEAPLIAGLPYAMPPAVPLPRPAAGCARAQSIADSRSIRDGTGVGNTTLSGWWIPTEADVPDEPSGAAPAPTRAAPSTLLPAPLKRFCNVSV